MLSMLALNDEALAHSDKHSQNSNMIQTAILNDIKKGGFKTLLLA
jgi:hypothetical protein